MKYDYDYLVIGSGFGGSVSALRLSEKGYTVGVVEMGRRYAADDFPKTNTDLKNFLWMPKLGWYGIQQMTLLKHVYVAHGCGVGGGSLNYANTLLVPPSHVFEDPRWPTDENWESKLEPHYAMAKKMLGAIEAKNLNESDELLRQVVDDERAGGACTFRKHTVSIFYGDKAGETVKDPFFNGEGPDRTACKECGECMSGCKHNSKNTLDKNYLYLAEQRGTDVIAERRVTDIRPLEEGGYELHLEESTKRFGKKREVLRARGVVVSASVLGTVELLLKCKERGSLSKLSNELGDYVRTNAETFAGVRSYDPETDFSKGISITSGVNTPEGTHIEAVRWGKGHDFLGMNVTVMTAAGPPWPRWMRWAGNALRHPIQFFNTTRFKGWAQHSVLLMGMRPSNTYMRLALRNKITGRHVDTKLTSGEKPESYMADVQEVAHDLAEKIGGVAQGGFAEAILDRATTAHILGGATMARDTSSGVCNEFGEVFGYDNLYVCDGSLVPANLTVNPSLTITALTEYVMSNISPKEGAEQKPVKLSELAPSA